MVDLPPEIQARRSVEDRALKLGAERAELDAQMALNTLAIKALMGEAEAAQLPLEGFAKMVGVSRQTLYHWRNETGFPGSPVSLDEPR
jgi:hypothetical protein